MKYETYIRSNDLLNSHVVTFIFEEDNRPPHVLQKEFDNENAAINWQVEILLKLGVIPK